MLDFQKRKRKYFDVVLHDGTLLKVPPPTVKVFEDIQEIAVDPQSTTPNQLTNLARAVLNTNKAGVQITDEQISAFDFDEITELFTGYANFITEALSDPNLKSPGVR